MENPFSSTQQKTIREQQLSDERVNVFMRQVYVTMSLGLLITALTAWFVAGSEALSSLFLSGGILTWIVMFVVTLSPKSGKEIQQAEGENNTH